eukprot:gi/632969431/ref/XP_007901085.1/ PREDICTED: barH-like 1 homeobox protein [Callorhinchus milii]
MEGSNFGIDSILSHRPASPPAAPKEDSLMGDLSLRSPPELKPGLSPVSDGGSEQSEPCSPGEECGEAAEAPAGPADGLDSQAHPERVSAALPPRTVTSSFLIRDILGECKPLAACAPYSSGGQAPPELPRTNTHRRNSETSWETSGRAIRTRSTKVRSHCERERERGMRSTQYPLNDNVLQLIHLTFF